MSAVIKRTKFILRYREWYGRTGKLDTLADRSEKVLGHRLDISTFNRWFNGNRRPTADNIEKLAEILEVTESWLRFGE